MCCVEQWNTRMSASSRNNKFFKAERQVKVNNVVGSAVVEMKLGSFQTNKRIWGLIFRFCCHPCQQSLSLSNSMIRQQHQGMSKSEKFMLHLCFYYYDYVYCFMLRCTCGATSVAMEPRMLAQCFRVADVFLCSSVLDALSFLSVHFCSS